MITRRDFMKRATMVGATLFLGGLDTRPVGAQSAPKRIVVGQGVDLVSTDPYGHSVAANYATWKHIMEPLIHFDYDKGTFYGILAESWKSDGTEWTFKLRKGVKFHSGADFTARDVMFSMETVRPTLQGKNNIPDVQDVKVVDDHTLKIITPKPVAALLSKLGEVVIVSQQAYEKYGKEIVRYPIGTGPFKFVEWVRGSYLVARRNEAYWGESPKIDEIIWRPIPEVAARVTALEAGEVDIATDVPSHEVERLNRTPGIRVEEVQALRVIFIGLPQTFQPFQNKLVRQAMNFAVDVDSLIKYVLEGRGYRTKGLVSPTLLGYDPDLKPYPYDLAKAKSLLAQAGYPNGFEVDFYASSGRYPRDRESAQAIGAQLAKVGIKANVITPEWSVFWPNVIAGKYNMFMYGSFNLSDVDLSLSPFLARTGYSNPEAVRLIDEQRQELNPEKRSRLIQRLMKIIHEDAPCIPLWHNQMLYGVRDKVVWKPNPSEDVMLHAASVR
jgi:peptide/nickel transport system substrate-binding protein